MSVTDLPASARPKWAADRQRGWWLLVSAVLVVVGALFPLGLTTLVDEAQYSLQALQINDGGWTVPDYTADVDDQGRLFGVANADFGPGDTRIYYARHPLWPQMLAVSVSVLGSDVGLRIWSLLGAAVCVVAAFLIAKRLELPNPHRVLWTLAASPLVFWAHVNYAHTVAAACCGFGFWLLLRKSDGARLVHGGWLLAGWSLIGIAIMLRSEALLLAVALLMVAPLRARGDRLIYAATGVVATGVFYALDVAWRSGVAGEGRTNLAVRGDDGSFISARLEGFFRTFFTAELDGAAAIVMMVGIAVGVALMLAARGRVRLARAGALLAVLSPLLLFGSSEPVRPGGLLVAWPLLAVALGLGVEGWIRRLPRWLPVSIVLFVGFVLATQYRVAGGDGGDVGARFLLIGVPVVVSVVCCVDLAQLGRRLFGVVVGLACLPMLGLVVDQSSRPVTEDLIAEYRALDVAYVVSPNRFLGNELWRVQSQRQFVYADADAGRTILEVADVFAAKTDRAVAVALPEDNRPDLGDRYCVIDAPENARVGIRLYVTSDQGSVPCAR